MKKEEKKKRFTATCTYCRNKYESDTPITKACCFILTINDRKTLTSKSFNKEGKEI